MEKEDAKIENIADRSQFLTPFSSYATFLRQGSMNVNERFQPLRNGLLEFLVLKVISARKAYAADILAALSPTEFKTQEGTLYPLLSRLRRDGLLEYEWQESEAGPPRKYYSLTEKGSQYLTELKNYWAQMNQTISKIGN
jgi:PadR family transcriptional regulator PadR